MIEFTGITIIAGPIASGKSSLLNEIILGHALSQRIIFDDIDFHNLSKLLIDELCRIKDISIFITIIDIKDIPLKLRKNINRIIFTNCQTMITYFHLIDKVCYEYEKNLFNNIYDKVIYYPETNKIIKY